MKTRGFRLRLSGLELPTTTGGTTCIRWAQFPRGCTIVPASVQPEDPDAQIIRPRCPLPNRVVRRIPRLRLRAVEHALRTGTHECWWQCRPEGWAVCLAPAVALGGFVAFLDYAAWQMHVRGGIAAAEWAALPTRIQCFFHAGWVLLGLLHLLVLAAVAGGVRQRRRYRRGGDVVGVRSDRLGLELYLGDGTVRRLSWREVLEGTAEHRNIFELHAAGFVVPVSDGYAFAELMTAARRWLRMPDPRRKCRQRVAYRIAVVNSALAAVAMPVLLLARPGGLSPAETHRYVLGAVLVGVICLLLACGVALMEWLGLNDGSRTSKRRRHRRRRR